VKFIRPDAGELIHLDTIERIWREAVQGTQYLRIRHVSGAIDDYRLTDETARKIIKYLRGYHFVEDLVEN